MKRMDLGMDNDEGGDSDNYDYDESDVGGDEDRG